MKRFIEKPVRFRFFAKKKRAERSLECLGVVLDHMRSTE